MCCSSASRLISRHMSARTSGSSPVVGSSRKSTSGSWTSPSATSSRRCIPPEYVFTIRSALGEPERLEQEAHALLERPTPEPVHLALQPDVLAPRRLAVDARALRDDADAATNALLLLHDVVAGDGRRARVRARQRRQDLHRRRLPR